MIGAAVFAIDVPPRELFERHDSNKPQIEIIKPSGRRLITLEFYRKRATTEEAHGSTVLGHAFEKLFEGSRLRLQRMR
jgi:hypothetical protein